MRHRLGSLLALLAAAAGASAFVTGRSAAQQNAPGPEQRVAALKQSLQDSQVRLRTYEWIETTIVSLKGAEKSRRQQRCYYGADARLQKVPLATEPQPQPSAGQGRGRRGGRLKQQIVENKKEDLQDYMKAAVSLVHQYVPPNPQDIERARKGGTFAMRPGEAGRVRLEFTDYLKPGDRLTIDVDAGANRLLGLNVSTYLDKPDDAVVLEVAFGGLVDGTSYTAETTLDAKSKNMRVVVQNSGHRPLTP